MYNFYQLVDCVSISPPRVGDKKHKNLLEKPFTITNHDGSYEQYFSKFSLILRLKKPQ